jgi:heat shock protein HtpX
MSRFLLFLLTNLAICLIIDILSSLLGLGSILANNGVDMNIRAVLIMSAPFGFTGSFISVALSKWMAMRSPDIRLI